MSQLESVAPCEELGVQFQDLMTYYPCASERPNMEPVVLFHGWGCDSGSWAPLLPFLRDRSDVITFDFLSVLPDLHGVDSFLLSVLDQLPSRFSLMGWSLGGMLATRLSVLAPERVTRLITMASNVKFVMSDHWSEAMPVGVYDKFYSDFVSAPEKTLKRFSGLMAKGDLSERALLKDLRGVMGGLLDKGIVTRDDLGRGLSVLGALDNESIYRQLKIPGLHVFGREDSLVPPTAAIEIERMGVAKQSVELVSGVSHVPHWSMLDSLTQILDAFMERSQTVANNLDKKRVAASFGRAAETYDSVAGLQRTIGDQLMAQMSVTPGDLFMDLGCGTGHFVPALKSQGLDVLGLDLAEGMLQFSKKRNSAHWVCADAENLPFKDDVLDGVFSSLAIQWCENISELFLGLKRVVRPSGKIYLATLGPRTLKELRESWRAVDGYVHVNRFVGEDVLKESIKAAGLSVRGWKSQDIVLEYDLLKELTHELKALGAHNVNAGQSAGLTGRERVKGFKRAYEKFRMSNGKLPATYEVFYMELEA